MAGMTFLERLQETERHVLSSASTRTDHADYVVSRAEHFKDWRQANMIEVRRPGRTLAEWESVFRTHFEIEAFPHLTIYIPNPEPFRPLIAEIEAVCASPSDDPGRLRMEHITYMFATDPSRGLPLAPELEIDVVQTDEDMADLRAFTLEEFREQDWTDDVEALRRYMHRRIELAERAGVTWLCLRRRGERDILSRLGIFDHGGVSRLQAVGTAKAHRRRGYASALVAHAIRMAIEQRASDGLALTVETGAPAQSMYASLGFEPVGSECWAMRYEVAQPPPDTGGSPPSPAAG